MSRYILKVPDIFLFTIAYRSLKIEVDKPLLLKLDSILDESLFAYVYYRIVTKKCYSFNTF